MAKSQILEKLRKKLETTPTCESDVVYILSGVRKILETNNYPEKYSCLNFYCNLALHSKIDRLPKSIHEMLIRIKDGGTNPDAYQNSIIGFVDLHGQFIEFLRENNLPDAIYTEKHGIKTFNKLLSNIYSDTPIILTIEKKIEILIDDNGGIRFKPKM